MKQTYIVPTMEELNIETVEMMALSYIEDETKTLGAGQELSTGRRGVWGNRWE